MDCWHITIASRSRFPIVPDEATRRREGEAGAGRANRSVPWEIGGSARWTDTRPGLDPPGRRPTPPPHVGRLRIGPAGALRLASAAAAALAVGPVMGGSTKEEVVARQAVAILGTEASLAPTDGARRAVVTLAAEAGIAPRDVAWALNASAGSVRRWAHQPVPPPVVEATRLRLALEDAARPPPAGR